MPDASLIQENNRNSMCNAIFYIYMIFVGFMYYCLYISSSPFTSVFVDTSDPEEFLSLLNFNLVENLPLDSIKNIIYTGYLFFSDDSFFSFVWTSFSLFAISAFLVYKMANLYKPNNYCGLLAVFIYTTITDILLNVFAINVHISETMFLLFILYFYAKSNGFSGKRYSVLYLLFSLMALFERESIVIYLSVIVLFTSLLSIKKKKYFSLIYNFLIVAMISVIVFSGTHSGYLLEKLGHWYIYVNMLDVYTICKLPYLIAYKFFIQLSLNISSFYLFLIAGCLLTQIIYPIKNRTKFFVFINLFVVFILFLYCLTIVPSDDNILDGIFQYRGAIFDDVMPVFAFVAIGLANFFYLYRKWKLYIFIFILFVYAANPINLLNYSIDRLKNREKTTLESRYKSFYELNDVSDTLTFLLDQFRYEKFMFVLEKADTANVADSLSMKSDYLVALDDLYVKLGHTKSIPDIFNEFMYQLAEIVSINGFEYNVCPKSEMNGMCQILGLRPENVCRVLLCSKTEQVRINSCTKKLKSWKVVIEDINFNLYLYVYEK